MQVHNSSSIATTATAHKQKESQGGFAEALQNLSMPDDVKEAFSQALESLDPNERLMAFSLTLDPAKLKARLEGSAEYTPTFMDYNYLQKSVDRMLNPPSGGYTSPEAKESIEKFWNAFESIYKADNTPNTDPQEEDDLAVVKFLEDLRTKGAIKFLADLNKEKIEKLVEEFRQKLLDSMGDSPEALKEIEELVAAYKKQLLEEMQNSLDAQENTRPINADAIIQTLLNAQTKQSKPLEELLRSS